MLRIWSRYHYLQALKSFQSYMWKLLMKTSFCCCCALLIRSQVEAESNNVGSSEGYKIASHMLINSMNFSVDPCIDFFEFTCGNWKANHPIPNHKTRYSQFEVVADKVQGEMRGIFESEEVFGSISMNTLKAMYRRCMDKDKLNAIGARRLIESIRNHSVWPMLDGDQKWSLEDFNLTSLLVHVAQVRGVHVFVRSYVTIDSRNVSQRIMKFEQGDLGLGDSRIGRIYYLDRKKHGRKIAAYRQFLISKITLLLEDSNQPKNETKIAKDVDEVVDFETMFAKILVADDDSRNFNTRHSLRRLKDLQKLMPVVNWAQYFHSVAPNVVHEYFASNPEIIIAEIDFMKRLTNLLQSTDPRIITNYVYMRYSSSWVGELGERYEDILQEFNRVMYGRNQKAQRWISCTDNIMQGMQYVSAAMYVRRVFDKTLKNIIFQMIEDLQKVFREIVITSDWMDNETKANALDKAKQMLRQVAYPDFVLDNAKLDDHYSGFSVEESDTYSQMVGKLSKWCLEYRYKQLIKPVDRTEFNFNSAVVNAYYSSTSNSIKLPAAIIQVPFFHPTFPRALNYGGIGAVIGHEIIHGFDDIGRQFDSFGNLRDWWNAGVKKKFEERSQCIINQYGKIEVPGTGLKVNGKLTQGENIADNGGIKQAFKAYKNYLLDHGEEMRIKGLEQYNNEQMFFLGYAMVAETTVTQHHQLIVVMVVKDGVLFNEITHNTQFRAVRAVQTQ
ncbi:hypothetical protein RB195_018025 [Necator americanus]|uniref:Peptidase family M13 n=1 Tax=Necator americanus TaxID=51031 RepID=A0ABR1C7U1_NECAM